MTVFSKKSILFIAFLCAAVALIFIYLPSSSQKKAFSQFPPDIKRVMNQTRYKNSFWWILVKDLNTGKTIYNQHADVMMMPASVTKLFTISTLLNDLDYDYRFKTPVYSTGEIDSNGTLNGNLVLVGSGDLTFGSRRIKDNIQFVPTDHTYANILPGATFIQKDPLSALNALAQQIAAKGIKRVNGDILVDNRAFQITKHRDYILSPLMINENFIDFIVNPTSANSDAVIAWRPKIAGYTVVNQVKTIANGPTEIEITSDPSKNTFYVKGTISNDSKGVLRIHKIDDPTKFARLAFIETLKKAGIEVNVPANQTELLPSRQLYQQQKPIAIYVSPPLIQYAKLILKVSHNPGADLVPLLLAAHHGLKTFDEGLSFIGKFATKMAGISSNQFAFEDAGGGNNNRATPYAITHLLTYIHNLSEAQYKSFYQALPALGVDGNLAAYGRQSPAKGHVHAKTGTSIIYDLANQRPFLFSEAAGGYIMTKNGHTLVYAVAVGYAPMKDINDAAVIANDIAKISSAIYNSN